MKHWMIIAAGFLALVGSPAFAGPVSFNECPAVGHDTTGCELLITVTGVTSVPGIGQVATAFTVTTSSPDLGPFDGSNDTLIGVLNASSSNLFKIFFTVAPGTGSFAFDTDGACKAAGSPLVSIYSPGPTASQCLQGQYQTQDAFDYASTSVTFCSFSLAAACVIVGEPSGQLPPGGTSWFSLPGAITASEITMVTPEPASLLLIGSALCGFYFRRRRKI
jgi:hypothetical protein